MSLFSNDISPRIRSVKVVVPSSGTLSRMTYFSLLTFQPATRPELRSCWRVAMRGQARPLDERGYLPIQYS